MKKKQVVIYIVLMLTLLCTSVYATISGSMSLTSSSSTVVAGEEFTVTLSLEDIDASTGITSVEGYINIDENVLEDLTVESIVTNSDGAVEINSNNILTVYDASSASASSVDTGIFLNTNPVSGKGDYRLVIDLAKAITSDTDLITITFKAKSDVSTGTYDDAIQYTLFYIYSGTESSAVTSKSLDVVIGTASDNNTNTNNNSNNNAANNNAANNNATNNNATNNSSNNSANNSSNNNSANNSTNNNTSNNSSNNSSNNTSNNSSSTNNSANNTVDNTTATGTLPNTGYRLVVIPVIVFAILGLVFYKKYNKYNKI